MEKRIVQISEERYIELLNLENQREVQHIKDVLFMLKNIKKLDLKRIIDGLEHELSTYSIKK